MAVAALATRLERRVGTRIGKTSYSPTSQRVLLALHHKPLRTDRAVGLELGMSSPQLSRDMTALIAKGWVRSRPSPDNKTQRLLELTEAGLEVAHEIASARQDAFDVEWPALRREEQQALLRAVDGRSLEKPATGEPNIRIAKMEDMPMVFHWMSTNLRQELGWNRNYIAHAARIMALQLERWPAEYPCGFVANIANRPVGCCLVMSGSDQSDVPDDGVTATITALYVAEPYRRRGLGGELLKRCVGTLREKTFLSLNVQIAAQQTALARVLKNAKFRRREGYEYGGRFGEVGKWFEHMIVLNPLPRNRQ